MTYASFGQYREMRPDEMRVGRRVFCYYISQIPRPAALGVITHIDRQGWADVKTDDGKTHYFNAERLAIKHGGHIYE